MSTAPKMLAALKTADRRIVELCAMINHLTGIRKVRPEDYAEEIRAAIAQAEHA